MHSEQLPKHQTKSSFRKTRRYLKKMTVRLSRRLGKRLREDAPPRNTKGWAD